MQRKKHIQSQFSYSMVALNRQLHHLMAKLVLPQKLEWFNSLSFALFYVLSLWDSSMMLKLCQMLKTNIMYIPIYLSQCAKKMGEKCSGLWGIIQCNKSKVLALNKIRKKTTYLGFLIPKVWQILKHFSRHFHQALLSFDERLQIIFSSSKRDIKYLFLWAASLILLHTYYFCTFMKVALLWICRT